MYIWKMQNEEHNQKALKSKWAPAAARPASYLTAFGPGIVLVTPSPSTTTASAAPPSPAAAFITAALTLAVVFAGQIWEVFKNSFTGHMQR